MSPELKAAADHLELEVRANIGLIETYRGEHFEEFIRFVANLTEPINPELYEEFANTYDRARNLDNLSPKLITAFTRVKGLQFTPDGKQVIGYIWNRSLLSRNVFDVVTDHRPALLNSESSPSVGTHLISGVPYPFGSSDRPRVAMRSFRILAIYETRDES